MYRIDLSSELLALVGLHGQLGLESCQIRLKRELMLTAKRSIEVGAGYRFGKASRFEGGQPRFPGDSVDMTLLPDAP